MINARCLCAFSFLSLILSLIQSLIEQSARALIWSSEINWQMGLLSQSRMFIASFAMLLIRVVRLLLRLKYNERNAFFFLLLLLDSMCLVSKTHRIPWSGNKKLLGTYQLHGISDWAWSNQNALVLLFNFAWYLRFKTPSSY